MTERQELICRQISTAIEAVKSRCRTPGQADYLYWCGYRDGLSKGHEIAQYATSTKRDPLLIPMLESGVHNTNYRPK